MKRIRTWLSVLLLAAPSALGAQTGAPTPEQEIQRSLGRAQQVGVPVELLESKIAEGKAKGVPMQRIAQAVANRLEVLERVQQKLAAHRLDGRELGVAADAAQSGVSDAVLEKLSQAAPREQRAVAIATLTQLVQMGHVPEEALQRVTEALARGPDALMNLPAQAAAARGRENGPGGSNGRGQGIGGGNGQGRGGPPAGVPAGRRNERPGAGGPTGPKAPTGRPGGAG